VNRNTASIPILVALAVATVSCAGDTDANNPAGATVRDSAGIRIVANGDPALAPGWRLEPLPIASIGNGMGDPRLELHDVTSIALQDDGSIVIANTGTHEVRFYTAVGAPGPVTGGPGEGPGEFVGEIQLANMPGDSILAYDWTQRRATILAPAGTVARTIDLRHLDPNVDLRGVMADGSLVLSLRHLMRMSADRLNTDSVVFVRTDSRGAPIDQLGWTRLTRLVFATYEGMPVIDELPFGPSGSAAAAGNGLVAVDGQAPEFIVRGDGGSPSAIVRWAAPPAEVTPVLIDRFREWDAGLERNQIEALMREHWLETVEFPDFVPATGGLVVDPASGRVFVEAWRAPWAPGDAAWLVFASDGRLIARLGVPDGFDLRAASGDLVAGLERDARDVEHVRFYRVDPGV
jgi:hypothetical protein